MVVPSEEDQVTFTRAGDSSKEKEKERKDKERKDKEKKNKNDKKEKRKEKENKDKDNENNKGKNSENNKDKKKKKEGEPNGEKAIEQVVTELKKAEPAALVKQEDDEEKVEPEPEFQIKRCVHDVCLPPSGIDYDPIMYPLSLY